MTPYDLTAWALRLTDIYVPPHAWSYLGGAVFLSGVLLVSVGARTWLATHEWHPRNKG